MNKNFENFNQNLQNVKYNSASTSTTTNTLKNLINFDSDTECTRKPSEPNIFNALSNVLDKRVSTFVEQIEPIIRSNIPCSSNSSNKNSNNETSVYDHCDNYRHLSVRIKNSIMFELKKHVSLLEYDSIFRSLSQMDKFKNIESNCCNDNFDKNSSEVKPVHNSPIISIQCGPSKISRNDFHIEWKVNKFYGISGYKVCVESIE